MPITTSAKKALRGSKRKRVVNMRRKAALKHALRTVRETAATKKSDSKEALSKAYQAIDKAVKRGILKKNTAARKKSRLSRMLAKLK